MNWKQLQGQIVDGEFQLVEHLGGTEESATFVAKAPGDTNAALKLVNWSSRDVHLLERWKISETLAHPNLLRVLRSGTCEVAGIEFLYVATEYAEENLSQVLPQRALTPDEVREMLPPVLDVLDYLHGKQLVHGDLKPANIMAAGDQLKLSSDGVLEFGELLTASGPYVAPEAASGVIPASDLWSLGVTLSEVLTQRLPSWETGSTLPQLPENMPDQFRVVVQRCLIMEPALRGTTADIRVRLKSPAQAVSVAASAPMQSSSGTPKRSVKWIAIPAVAAVAIGGFIAINHRTEITPQSENAEFRVAPQTQASQPPPVQSPPPSVFTEATDPRPAPEKALPEKPQKLEVLMPAKSPAAVTAPETPKPAAVMKQAKPSVARTDNVVHQVMPDIPQKAMNTINGKFRVTVKVRVNRAGEVVASELVSRGPSKYFADRALQAAKEWKFSPAGSEQAWDLEFEFRRSGIITNPSQINQ